MTGPAVCIVTPALAQANNGNWQTASRWSRMLAAQHRVSLVQRWQGEPADLMLALHARRSADSIARWAEQQPRRPLVVALTGTDLYRDLPDDADAQRSIALADRLLVLQDQAVMQLPAEHRHKAVVCYQSTTSRAARPKSQRYLRALMVGHMRAEKSPQTYFEAARRLAARDDLQLDYIGAALDPELGREARAVQAECPRFAWLGEQPHASTRRHIQRAHLLVNTSLMEGGAHVVMEAIRSGTPVLATRVSGNVGMLGADYGGYYDTGDAAGLATLLATCRDEPSILAALSAQCAARDALFEPARERATLCALTQELLLEDPT